MCLIGTIYVSNFKLLIAYSTLGFVKQILRRNTSEPALTGACLGWGKAVRGAFTSGKAFSCWQRGNLSLHFTLSMARVLLKKQHLSNLSIWSTCLKVVIVAIASSICKLAAGRGPRVIVPSGFWALIYWTPLSHYAIYVPALQLEQVPVYIAYVLRSLPSGGRYWIVQRPERFSEGDKACWKSWGLRGCSTQYIPTRGSVRPFSSHN